MKNFIRARGIPWGKLVAAAGCVVMAGGAAAQDPGTPAEDDAIEEIVVEGFRGSIRQALEAKRNATGMVDSIMAEDIADWPDTNLAESLQRIPGIAITREAGEGRNITVRGLDSKFTRVTINGAMAQSLAAGSGGAQSDRSFDFNVFASELFNRIDVYKTTSAAMEEGSLGATVALHTGRPFDYDPLTVAANIQAGYNDQSEETVPRASGLVSVSNADRTFGGLLSVSYSERYVNNSGPQTGRWEDDTFASCSACGGDPAAEAAVYAAPHPRFPRYADKSHDHERLGVTGTVQWAPTDSTLLTGDILYATIDARRDEPFMQAISLARTGSTGVQETDVAAYTIDPNGTLIAATMDGVDTRSENFVAFWDSEFVQYQLTLEQDFTDRIRMDAMVATSDSELDNQETTLALEHFSDGDPRQYDVYAQAADAVSYDYTDMLSPSISYNWDTTDPANWEVSEFRDRIHHAESGFDTLQLGVEFDLTDELALQVGYSYKEYTFDQMQTRADALFEDVDGTDGAVDGVACGIGFDVDSSMGSVVDFGATPFFMAGDSQFQMFRDSGCWPQYPRAGDDRTVVETDDAYYVQLNFTGYIADMELRGNVGIREVTTDLEASGVTQAGDDLIDVTVPTSYSDTLPAANFALNITDNLIARAAWAQVMSRPDLGLLSPGGSVTIFGVPAVSYGNPFLEPYRAANTDLSLEWYFAPDSLLAIAWFEKDIESFPTSESTILPWSEVGLPDSVLGAQRDDLIDADFEVTRRINGGGARLDGWELQYQQLFTFLPNEFLQNFGIVANYTMVDSKVDSSGLSLTGQSDDSYNFTVFWENDVFSTRLAYSYRGEYNTRNDDDPEGIRFRDETANLDFAASYSINDNFAVTFEAINLTDEPQIDWMAPGFGPRLIETQYTGTQWYLGASWQL